MIFDLGDLEDMDQSEVELIILHEMVSRLENISTSVVAQSII